MKNHMGGRYKVYLPPSIFEVCEMNEKSYKNKIDLQQKMISHQSQQIEDLKQQVIKLQLEIEEKNKIINSVAHLREELAENVDEAKKYKEESKGLMQELRKMKDVMNRTVFKGRWRLVRLLIK